MRQIDQPLYNTQLYTLQNTQIAAMEHALLVDKAPRKGS